METLRTLPGDDVRQIMWRYADRFDLQMLIQSTRAVARGPVAHLVANGARNTHEWTDEKNTLLEHYDQAGMTAAFADPEHGGYIPGPKNMVCSMLAFELAWVDGGASTGSLAGNLALAPIHERGTDEQKAQYIGGSVPPQPGEDREILRGAFGLTEPLPYVGVETGMLCGKMRVVEWEDGKEPMIQVEKRGRFITNMGFANFITAAVDTDDDRIKTSCMVIIEEDDEGSYDRGAPTLKLVHQLSSTSDPIINVKVPASRIIGGYTIEDGKIVPNYSHGEVIDAVFKRTRITVSLMTAAKLLSAVEPVIRYQRTRFRGAEMVDQGTPRYELGIQQKEGALHLLADVWATGEAAASLGFEASRVFDVLDPLEEQKNEILRAQGATGSRSQFRALRPIMKDALELLEMEKQPEDERDQARYEELKSNTLVQYVLVDAVGNVLCPASKLWNTGHGATMLREAVSLMGGYGITEDCPGFLCQKWMDAQLEATYEGPEAVQRRQLSVTMTQELFLKQLEMWIDELKELGKARPASGACALTAAFDLWMHTLSHLQKSKDANGKRLYQSSRQGVAFPLADAISWLLAARSFMLDVKELEAKGPENPTLAEGIDGLVSFYYDLAHVQAAHAAGEASRICAELVFGYNEHPGATCGCGCNDEAAADLSEFFTLRNRVDNCLAGTRLSKDRAAKALSEVMIPEALDYPL